MRRLILCVSALVLASVTATAAPGTAVSTVNLRAEANTSSAVLAKIPGGSRVEVGDCTGGWCAVTFQGKSGFAIQTAFDMSGRARTRARGTIGPRRSLRGAPPPGYDVEPAYPAYGPPVVVAPPIYGPPVLWGGGPYWGYRRWGYGWRRW
jgi:uncharacterized protein YraI